jgi:hypothetical protein
MTGLLGKLFGKGGGGSAPQDDVAASMRQGFLADLAFYPPRVAPHAGLPASLTDAQVDENHAWFMRVREERLAGLVNLLGDAEVDVAPLLDAPADPAPSIESLRRWLEGSLPDRKALPCGEQTNSPERDYLSHAHIGPRIFYAFSADLATLYGEAIVRRRSDFTWGVDRFRDSVGMAHHRRTAVLRPPTGGWTATVLDMELDTLQRLYAMRGGGPGVAPTVGSIVTEVMAGGLDPR